MKFRPLIISTTVALGVAIVVMASWLADEPEPRAHRPHLHRTEAAAGHHQGEPYVARHLPGPAVIEARERASGVAPGGAASEAPSPGGAPPMPSPDARLAERPQPESRNTLLSWLSNWLWPDNTRRGTRADASSLASATGDTRTSRLSGRHNHSSEHRAMLSGHPHRDLSCTEADNPQLVRTADVVVRGAGISAADLQLAAQTTQQWLTRYKMQLGLTGLAGLSGQDAVTVCMSITNDGLLASGSFQGLKLKPLSNVLASGGSQLVWQAELAHELVKVMQAVLLQDRSNQHPLPRWFQEGMAAYLAQSAYLDTSTKVVEWATRYDSSGQCGPLSITSPRDLMRCGVTQETLSYRPAYATLMHWLFDSSASGGAGASLGALTGVLTNMAYGATFAQAFETQLGGTVATAWHGQVLAPGY